MTSTSKSVQICIANAARQDSSSRGRLRVHTMTVAARIPTRRVASAAWYVDSAEQDARTFDSTIRFTVRFVCKSCKTILKANYIILSEKGVSYFPRGRTRIKSGQYLTAVIYHSMILLPTLPD